MKTLFTLDRILQSPPTAEQLQEEGQRAQRHKNLRAFMMVVMPLCACHYEWLMLAGFFVSVTALMALLFMGELPFQHSGFSRDALDYEDLPSAWCTKMLRACNRTPEGRVYRAAVQEQGRAFTRIELDLVLTWNEYQRNEKACRTLYGMPA